MYVYGGTAHHDGVASNWNWMPTTVEDPEETARERLMRCTTGWFGTFPLFGELMAND